MPRASAQRMPVSMTVSAIGSSCATVHVVSVMVVTPARMSWANATFALMRTSSSDWMASAGM